MRRLTANFFFALLLLLPFAAAADTSTSGGAYPLAGGHVTFSNPTLADLTGDGTPEVVVGTSMNAYIGGQWVHDRMSTLSVLHGDGSPLWEHGYDAPIGSTPAVGDIDADGLPEVLVGLGGDAGNVHHPGGLVAVGADGNQKWRYYLPDWYPLDGKPDAVFASPSICEVDGDPYREIAFAGWDHHIHLVDHLGNALWGDPWLPGHLGLWNMDTVWGSPACADLDGDGLDEIVIGTDISCCGVMPDGTPGLDGGYVYVIDGDGTVLVRRFVNDAVYSSVALGDINSDGILDIVTGTSNSHRSSGVPGAQQPYTYAFSTHNVTAPLHHTDPAKLPALPGWPVGTPQGGMSSPALADLDLDGDLEVVIVKSDESPGSARLYAWHGNGQLVSGFPVTPSTSTAPMIWSSPIVANIDANRYPEILVSHDWQVGVYGHDGSYKGSYATMWTVGAAPAVGDTDGDRLSEVWVGGSHQSNPAYGYLWSFDVDGPAFGASVFSTSVPSVSWPMFRRGPMHHATVP